MVYFIFCRLMQIHESGLLFIWKQRRWPKKNTCGTKLLAVPQKITMAEVQSAFYVTAIGITLATIVICIEKASKHCTDVRKRRKDDEEKHPEPDS